MWPPRLHALKRVGLPHLACWHLNSGGLRGLSTGAHAASALIRGELNVEKAALQAVSELSEQLAGGGAPDFTLWFAKGYGGKAQPLGPLLKEKLGGDGVIIGSSAEAGLIGNGAEVQNETFALSVLVLRTPGVRLFPFHCGHLGQLPELGRGGTWADLSQSSTPPCILAFATLPMQSDPQGWCALLDNALGVNSNNSDAHQKPVVIGGLTVGHHIYVDGVHHVGGAFGVAMLPESANAPGFEALVCQGAVPFGPCLNITGVLKDHVISELDGKNPKAVLEPLLQGPQVPGKGHTMAGIFVDSTPEAGVAGAAHASTRLSGRPNCVVRPLHAWTPEGHVVLSPLTDLMPYAPGMQLQLHCMNQDLTLEDLRMRAGFDVMANNGSPPDAAVVISCGARGQQLYGEEGVESRVLRQAWGRDVPTVGFFAGGEIGPVGNRTYMHGFTTSCLLIRTPSSG